MNQNACVACKLVIYTLLLKVNDFSKSQAVTYIANMVISRKRCLIEM